MDLSVIIPVYNTEDYLKQCLESIPRSDIDLEILCMNDGSTDGSLACLLYTSEAVSKMSLLFGKGPGRLPGR